MPKKYPIEVIMKTGSTIFMIEGIILAILSHAIYYDCVLIVPDIEFIIYSIISFLNFRKGATLISDLNTNSEGGLSRV